MYTLRVIDQKGIEQNQSLGESYVFIHRHLNYEEFCELFLKVFGEYHCTDSDQNTESFSSRCYGFIDSEKGRVQPLYKDQSNYVMTENGNTFSNLTYKN